MKKLAALMMTAAPLAVSALAQAPESIKLRLTIPVTVSGVVLGTGDYTIRDADSGGNTVLSIESDMTKTRVLALANPINHANAAVDADGVMLLKDGDKYRISQVWIGSSGYEILNIAAK